MSKQSEYPRGLRGLTVAIVGAHVTGVIYAAAAVVTTGSIALTSWTHVTILTAAVAATTLSARTILRAMDREPESLKLQEERA